MLKVTKLITKFIDERFWLIILFAFLFHLFLILYFSITDFISHDISIWYEISKNLDKEIPFISTNRFVTGATEYPPLFTYFLTIFYPIAKFGRTAFMIAFGIVQLFCWLGLVLLLSKMLKNKLRILGFALAPTVIVFLSRRFDLLPTFLVLFSIYLWVRKKEKISGVVTAAASSLKVYPVTLLLSFLKTKGKNLLQFTIYFSLTFLLIFLPVLFFQPTTIFFPLKQGDYRDDTFVGILRLSGFKIDTSFATIVSIIFLIVLVGLAFFKAHSFLGRTVALIIPLVLTHHYFSPQWNLWFLPLLILSYIDLTKILTFDFISALPFMWGKIAEITGFYPELFSLNSYPSTLLILLRYAFFLYFYVKAIRCEKFGNKQMIFTELI